MYLIMRTVEVGRHAAAFIKAGLLIMAGVTV